MHLKYKYTIVNIDDDWMAIRVDEEREAENKSVIRLNETGMRIFGLLENEVTLEGIIDSLAKEYVMDDEAVSYARKFIDQLSERGIIE